MLNTKIKLLAEFIYCLNDIQALDYSHNIANRIKLHAQGINVHKLNIRIIYLPLLYFVQTNGWNDDNRRSGQKKKKKKKKRAQKCYSSLRVLTINNHYGQS